VVYGANHRAGQLGKIGHLRPEVDSVDIEHTQAKAWLSSGVLYVHEYLPLATEDRFLPAAQRGD
jgi:hypothetical protein